MLVLTRKTGEEIIIDGSIRITITSIKGSHVRIGITAPKSRTKSNRSLPTKGSRTCAQNSRIFGSSAFIFFGVNTLARRLRCAECKGGSSKMKTPEGISMLALINSRMPPFAELKVA